MQVLAISGSLRVASVNTALLRSLQAAAEGAVGVDLFEGLAGLPVFSPDLEGPPAPAAVEAFAARVAAADAIVIGSPEYARTIPGGLKNAIDWLVSRGEIIDKPIALLHASHRGDEMLGHLCRVLETVSSRFAPQLLLRVPVAHLTEEDRERMLGSEEVAVQLRGFLAALRGVAQSEAQGDLQNHRPKVRHPKGSA